jgi:hypothetical protein
MSHWNWNAILTVVVAVLGGLINHSVKTPKDHDRALQVSLLADDAAAVVLALNASAPWAQLVTDTVNRLKAAAGIPTTNLTALEQAATGALMRLGKTPQ